MLDAFAAIAQLALYVGTLAASDVAGVLLPLSSLFLGRPYAPGRELVDAGGIVALVIDGVAGSGGRDELTRGEALDPARRLGEAPVTDDAMLAAFPPSARALITASMHLHRRVALLDAALDAPRPAASPALSMQDRLARVL